MRPRHSRWYPSADDLGYAQSGDDAVEGQGGDTAEYFPPTGATRRLSPRRGRMTEEGDRRLKARPSRWGWSRRGGPTGRSQRYGTRDLLVEEPGLLLELREIKGGAGDRLAGAAQGARVAADDDDGVDGRAGDGDSASRQRDFVNERGPGSNSSGPSSAHRGAPRIEAFRLHLNPAAEVVVGLEWASSVAKQ